MKNDETPKCFHCGSSLILVSQKTDKIEGSTFPHTTIKYRCSDKKCQEEIDRQIAKRQKIQEEKELIEKKRAEMKIKNRALKLKNTPKK